MSWLISLLRNSQIEENYDYDYHYLQNGVKGCQPLTLCSLETPKQVLWAMANSEDPDEMLHKGLYCLLRKSRSAEKDI